MPKIYRVMRVEGGAPVVGNQSYMLGVRTPPHDHPDIEPVLNNNVGPTGHGMSVNPSISLMLPHMIPARWRDIDIKYASARGKTEFEVFTHGEGPFVNDAISPDLQLTPDNERHGVVEPAHVMLLKDYERALADTRRDWRLLVNPDGS